MRNLAYVETFESWADLNCGYYNIIPNKYMISTFGRVMNKQTGLILKQYMSNSGYWCVCLSGFNAANTSFFVHRLVLLTFRPIYNANEMTVNHIDCIKTNNNLFNLEWMTQAENNAYKFKTHTDNCTGENSVSARITNDQARIICEELEKGTRYKDILAKIGYIPAGRDDTMYDLIGHIKARDSWNQISKDYDFDNVYYNNSNYTDEQVRYICQCLSNGMSVGDIYNSMNDDEYINCYVNDKFYGVVMRIKNRKTFKRISCDYVF